MFCRLIVWIVCLLAVAEVGAAPASRQRAVSRRNRQRTALPPSSTTSSPFVFPPFTRCGTHICDLRTHYCDKVTMGCALCIDDCHPMRIGDNPAAIEECNRNCGWYYVFTSTPTTAAAATITVTAPLREIDEWGINGKKTFVFLLTSLMISLLVILLLTVGFIANICIRAFANDQPGNRRAVCMDASSHCRLVDDSKLLTKNVTVETPENSHDLPTSSAAAAGSDATTPKVAGVHRGNYGSLRTNVSTEPLLGQCPDSTQQVL